MKSLMSLFAVVMVLVTLPVSVCASLGDLDLETQRFLSLVYDKQSKSEPTLGATLFLPMDVINGGIAFSYQRSSIKNGNSNKNNLETLETLQYRVQGGPEYLGVSLQFFVDGERIVNKENDFRYTDVGAFVRPGVLILEEWELSGGVGTYLRGGMNKDLQDHLIGEGQLEPGQTTLPKPIAFVSLSRQIFDGDFNLIATWSPTFSFDYHDLLIEPRFSIEAFRGNWTLVGQFGERHGEFVNRQSFQFDVPF